MIKKSFLLFVSALFLIPVHSLRSEFEDDIVSGEQITSPGEAGAFRFALDIDVVGNADINKKDYKDQSVKFSSIAADAGAVLCYSKKYREALMIAGGYTQQKIQWTENPYFDQDIFDTASVSFRAYSNRLADWEWQALATVYADIEHFRLSYSTYYDFMLWGRYKCSDVLGFHAGFYLETGMRLDRIYPIIGFDWVINDSWKLNAVFPVNISLEYSIACNWKAALAMRFFDVRHRAGEDEPLPMAIVAYRNVGTECAIKYLYESNIEANIHVGWTFAGKLRISDRMNRHPKHFKLDPAGYVGGAVIVKF